MMYELTPGAQMPEVDHSDRECWREPNEPANDLSPVEYDEEDIPF